MKKLSFAILFALLLSLTALAQPSQCTVTGTIYTTASATGSAAPCSSCQIQITGTQISGSVVGTGSVIVTANGSGVVSFSVPRGSITTLRGPFTVGTYNYTNGLKVYIPNQASATLESDIKTVEDALAALMGVTTTAPSTAKYLLQTANASLPNAQAMGTLGTGLVKNTTTTGVQSIAVAGTDYESPLTFAARLNRSTNTIDLATTAVTPGSYTAANITVDAYGRVTAAANGSGGGSVTSVFGRSGAVVAATNDYTWAQVDKSTSSLADITTRSASDLSSGTVPLARLSGITTSELSATAGITNAQLAGSIAYSKLSLTGSIVNADISNSAAIAYSKLNLTGAILNADLAGSIAYSKLSLTGAILNADLAGSIANNKLANSAITIAGSSTSLGGSITASAILDSISSTQGTVLYRGASGWAALAAGTSGNFLKTNGAGADPAWAAVTAGAAGSDTQLQRNTSGSLGGISGATSDGTNVTFGSGNLRATSPRITTSILDTNGNSWLGITATGSATQFLTLSNDVAAGTVAASVNAPTQASASVAGTNLSFTASAATAGSSSAGAAAGGAISFTTGAAARFTSGNANGGNFNITLGAPIGTGDYGLINITGLSAATLTSTATNELFTPNGISTGTITNTTVTLVTTMGSNGFIVATGKTYGFGSASGHTARNAAIDAAFDRSAAGAVRLRGSTTTTAATLGVPPNTPAQITSDQNNYAPGVGWFQRWSSDASRNITGLSAGNSGDIIEIWNVGSQNIVLQNENASSTAANRFTTSTGADLTLSANKCAKGRYDATSSRWRVYLCN